jgi:hypothetical protein
MINFSILQIILVLLASFMILHGLARYIKREQGQSFFKLAANVIIWSVILIFTLFPAFSHTLTRDLGLGENLNTLIFLGFVVIFFVITKIIRIIERVEQNISEIVRKEALDKINKL